MRPPAEKNAAQTVEGLSTLESALSRDISLLDASMLEKSAQQDERVDDLSAMLIQVERVAKDDVSALARESSVELADAKAQLKTVDAKATADEKSSDARKDAAAAKLDAEYKVAKEKCDAMAGNAKDVCVKDAKARFGK